MPDEMIIIHNNIGLPEYDLFKSSLVEEIITRQSWLLADVPKLFHVTKKLIRNKTIGYQLRLTLTNNKPITEMHM